MFTLVERPFGINGVGLCVVDTLSFEAGSTIAFFRGSILFSVISHGFLWGKLRQNPASSMPLIYLILNTV
jgi:hypothetical protein